VTARSFKSIVPRGDRLRLVVAIPRQLSAPLPAQAAVGTVSVVDGRRVLARIPLLLTRKLTPVSGLTSVARFITRPLILLVIVAAGIGGLLWRGMRRRRRMDHQRGEVEAA
jgi:hypothetical protein